MPLFFANIMNILEGEYVDEYKYLNLWSGHINVLIFKGRDLMILNNHRTSIISYYLAKLYGLILESGLILRVERNGCCSARQVGFQKEFTTFDHTLNL